MLEDKSAFELAVCRSMQVTLYLYLRANVGREFDRETLEFVTSSCLAVYNTHLLIGLELVQGPLNKRIPLPRGRAAAFKDIDTAVDSIVEQSRVDGGVSIFNRVAAVAAALSLMIEETINGPPPL